jgi:ABC-2 type transport system ATP-binding protein
MSTIEVRNLSKRFGNVQALKDVTVTFAPEKIYGFLGRNGAGKTTLLNLITNRYFPDQGQPAWENDRAQQKIFYMTENTLYPNEMKVRDVFKVTRDFYPNFDPEAAHVLAEKFQLEPKKRIDQLSTGYKSIFKLILTLSANTPVLLFDEPVLGLDANHREMFYKELLAHYSAHPKTVILSTHIIGEIADLLEEVIILKAGEIILAQPVEQLLQLAYTVSGKQEQVDRFTRGKPVIREDSLGNYKAATIYQARNGLDRQALADSGLDITPPRLQELFISLTGS